LIAVEMQKAAFTYASRSVSHVGFASFGFE